MHGNESYSLLSVIMVIFIAPLYEELLYRGIGIEILKKFQYNNTAIILITSFLFSILHLPSVSQFIPLFILGVFCSFSYLQEQNIMYPFIIHIIYNSFESLVYSYL